jgi:glyoxylase-like metal-dependent hydrolase (beta-lactamase superfamily II)
VNIQTVKGIFDSNTYVVELNGTCIIIEAGADVNEVVCVLGSRKPSAIFLTHEHYDHVFYLTDYQRAFPGCPIYCHPAVVDELKCTKFNTMIGKHFGKQMMRVTNFRDFQPLADNQELSFGDLKKKTIFAPGHSLGSVVYKINNDLFTGDVLFRTHIGRTDFLPNGHELMQATLRKLQNIKFNTMYNGHSEPSSYTAQQENIKRHLED